MGVVEDLTAFGDFSGRNERQRNLRGILHDLKQLEEHYSNDSPIFTGDWKEREQRRFCYDYGEGNYNTLCDCCGHEIIDAPWKRYDYPKLCCKCRELMEENEDDEIIRSDEELRFGSKIPWRHYNSSERDARDVLIWD